MMLRRCFCAHQRAHLAPASRQEAGIFLGGHTSQLTPHPVITTAHPHRAGVPTRLRGVRRSLQRSLHHQQQVCSPHVSSLLLPLRLLVESYFGVVGTGR